MDIAAAAVIITSVGVVITVILGFVAVWIAVRGEIQGVSQRLSETELAQARREGETRILARIAHGHEAASRGGESTSSDGEDDKDD